MQKTVDFHLLCKFTIKSKLFTLSKHTAILKFPCIIIFPHRLEQISLTYEGARGKQVTMQLNLDVTQAIRIHFCFLFSVCALKAGDLASGFEYFLL
jgi:hypothetical protein